MDPSINNVHLKVQPRSGYDKAFMSQGSGNCGQLIPIFVDEILPNSKIDIKLGMNVSLPPLANDMYMRVSQKLEAFFVPMRLLVGSFQNWFTGTTDDRDKTQAKLPYVHFEGIDEADGIAIKMLFDDADNYLFDWLGIRIGSKSEQISIPEHFQISLLPFLAYHKIYDDWYRRTLIQKSPFIRPIASIAPFETAPSVRFMPYYYTYEQNMAFQADPSFVTHQNMMLEDGVSVFALRQRNFGYDAFTVANTSPQLGDAQAVEVDSQDGFTIAALRAANSMQQFEEFNQLAGSRFQDQLRVRYGASLSDGVAQRAIFLGSAEFEVYSKGVYQSVADNPTTPQSRNPYNAVGSRYGSAYASGNEFIISGFHAQEPGFIMVLSSLVPRRTYATGVLPFIEKYCGGAPLTLMGNAMLQNIGNQPIKLHELGCMTDGIFGWQQRFAEYMYRNDEVHSHMRPGGHYEAFSLNEAMPAEDAFEISTSFLQIPRNYLKKVFAVDLPDFPDYWFDCWFDYRNSQPLAKFAIPSLQNPAYEHGETITVRRGGISL